MRTYTSLSARTPPSIFIVASLGWHLFFHRVRSDVLAFSAQGSPGKSGFGVGLDRFQVTCPADLSCIEQFDPSLVGKGQQRRDSNNSNNRHDDHGDNGNYIGIWAAVYRSNQNQPSVFVRDEFFHSMKSATTLTTWEDDSQTSTSSTTSFSYSSSSSASASSSSSWTKEMLETPHSQQRPVAVAQLRASEDYQSKWVIDFLRCALKKEDMDDRCDGGSEFLEALSVGLDSLVLYYLKERHDTDSNCKKRNVINKKTEDDDEDAIDNHDPKVSTISFEGAIRTKATLFSKTLLVDRGFRPVEYLSKDMATHISTLAGCFEKYSERCVDPDLNMGARDRALQIVSILGTIMDRSTTTNVNDDENNNDDMDPWANINMRL